MLGVCAVGWPVTPRSPYPRSSTKWSRKLGWRGGSGRGAAAGVAPTKAAAIRANERRRRHATRGWNMM